MYLPHIADFLDLNCIGIIYNEDKRLWVAEKIIYLELITSIRQMQNRGYCANAWPLENGKTFFHGQQNKAQNKVPVL